MKGDYIRIAVTVVFPVVVDTIQPHIHQDIDKRFGIFVFVTLFLRNQSRISSITATRSPTFEKFDTAKNIGSVFMSSICPGSGSLKNPVIPRAE